MCLKKISTVCYAGMMALLLVLAPALADEGAKRVEGGMVIEHGVVRVLVSDRLEVVPSLLQDGSAISFVEARSTGRPSFYAVFGGLEVTDFKVDWNGFESEQIDDPGLGQGMRYTLPARAEQYGTMLYAPLIVAIEVNLTFYNDFPAVIFTRAEFKNEGAQRLEIGELVANHFRLNRKLIDAEADPWDFVSYQGAATRWGWDYSLIPLTSTFDRRNFMGMGELASSDIAGGGTPLVDIWSPQMGLAIASAEASQQWISLPVKTAGDGTVEISIKQSPDARLGQVRFLDPGQSVATIDCAVILHKLDFFDPLRIYANILRARGVDIPLESSEQTFEPYWKSWGLRMDFTLEGIYTSLEEQRSVGLSWANLDDGWFDWYGDWNLNTSPGKFPGGEPDMVAFVDSVHRSGFKTSLWWYPQGASLESRLAREHPEWLVHNEDGSLPLSKRGLYYLCPVYQPCIDHAVALVRKFMGEWDFDGLYVDTQDLTSTPPCFNPAHNHKEPLESFQGQPRFYEAIYREAMRIKPGSPLEMCICAMPHDPFKMPYYNVANASDPTSLVQTRRRIKVEKAYRGASFAVGDCYQVPMDEWEGFSVPESFESAIGTGAQVTTFFTDLTPEQERTWKRWLEIYRQKGLAWSEYLNLYDIAYDLPEGHVVRAGDKMYYGFYSQAWSVGKPIELRGLEKGRLYKVYEYGRDEDLGTVSGDDPYIRRGFRDNLLLEVTPVQ